MNPLFHPELKVKWYHSWSCSRMTLIFNNPWKLICHLRKKNYSMNKRNFSTEKGPIIYTDVFQLIRGIFGNKQKRCIIFFMSVHYLELLYIKIILILLKYILMQFKMAADQTECSTLEQISIIFAGWKVQTMWYLQKNVWCIWVIILY